MCPSNPWAPYSGGAGLARTYVMNSNAFTYSWATNTGVLTPPRKHNTISRPHETMIIGEAANTAPGTDIYTVGRHDISIDYYIFTSAVITNSNWWFTEK